MTLTKQRARRAEDKEARRRDLLQAALVLLDERRFADIKMADVARQAAVAKGTVFLYFPTKEALFLELLEEKLAEWLEEVNAELDGGKGRWTGARVARLMADTLASHDALTRLLTLCSSVLEQNVDVDRIAAFKQRLIVLLGATGTRIEQRLAFVRAGQGTHLLLHLYAIVVGVRQLSDPGPLAQEALARPELSSLRFDFDTELRALLASFFKGLEFQAKG